MPRSALARHAALLPTAVNEAWGPRDRVHGVLLCSFVGQACRMGQWPLICRCIDVRRDTESPASVEGQAAPLQREPRPGSAPSLQVGGSRCSGHLHPLCGRGGQHCLDSCRGESSTGCGGVFFLPSIFFLNLSTTFEILRLAFAWQGSIYFKSLNILLSKLCFRTAK